MTTTTEARLNVYADVPAQFRFVEEELPPLRPRDIEIDIQAASINPLDLLMANGYGRRLFGFGPGGRLPLVLGRDGSGIVTKAGTQVADLQPGMHVWFALPPFVRGSYATRIQIPAKFARPQPACLTSVEAASLPYAGVTAMQLLEAAQLNAEGSRGRRVFVHGASGGIGMILISQLAAWGASVSASASPSTFDALYRIGRCSYYDSRGPHLHKGISECDTLLNLVAPGDGAFTTERILIDALPDNARYVTPITPVAALFDKHGLLGGAVRCALYKMSARRYSAKRGISYDWVLFKPSAAQLDELSRAITAGVLTPPPQTVFDFSQLQQAHAAASRSPRIGKIVVQVSRHKGQGDTHGQ